MTRGRSDDVRTRLSTVALPDLTAAQREAIVRLCTAAHGVDFGPLFDFLRDSTHVLARLGDEIVGHACWSARGVQPAGLPRLRAAFVDAVATAPEHQGRGIGSAVMRRLAEEVAAWDLGALGTERVWFYERLGWERWRGPLDGLPDDPSDVVMILRTPRTPPLDTAALLVADRR